MRYLFSVLFLMAALCGFSQEETKVIPGDKVEITKPVVKDTMDLVDTYDQDIADIANIDRYIAEMQSNIAEAERRKAERLARIALIEKRALQIKEEKEVGTGGK